MIPLRECVFCPVTNEAGSGSGTATGGYFWVLRTRNGELLKIRNLLKLRAVSGRDWEGRVEGELVQLRFGIGFEHEMPAPKPAKLNGYIPDRPQACGPRLAGLLGD
jgi:hypothetical protein